MMFQELASLDLHQLFFLSTFKGPMGLGDPNYRGLSKKEIDPLLTSRIRDIARGELCKNFGETMGKCYVKHVRQNLRSYVKHARSQIIVFRVFCAGFTAEKRSKTYTAASTRKSQFKNSETRSLKNI